MQHGDSSRLTPSHQKYFLSIDHVISPHSYSWRLSGWQPTHFSRAQLEERRLAVLDWIAQNTHKNQKIADHLGVSVLTVYSWKGRFKCTGSLQATVAGGAASRLTTEHGEQLREGAVQQGVPDETWTARRVKNLIGRRFDVWYHHDHVRHILRRLGFTPQTPDGRAAERNELRIASWREQGALKLEKKVAKGAALVHLDEVGCALKGVRRRAWSIKGVTPLVTLPAKWEKLSTIGAINSAGQFL
ncbi:IS630 family transposase [Deinococcus sp. Arct2-2]|nr:IS630 family transposase [Deinococcus sp. Arct2-2]